MIESKICVTSQREFGGYLLPQRNQPVLTRHTRESPVRRARAAGRGGGILISGLSGTLTDQSPQVALISLTLETSKEN